MSPVAPHYLRSSRPAESLWSLWACAAIAPLIRWLQADEIIVTSVLFRASGRVFCGALITQARSRPSQPFGAKTRRRPLREIGGGKPASNSSISSYTITCESEDCCHATHGRPSGPGAVGFAPWITQAIDPIDGGAAKDQSKTCICLSKY
eukprot:1625150-Pyramimonas_sp.AAC.1